MLPLELRPRTTKCLSDLYPHQIRAIEKLDSGKILCGGVGSGKSRTAIGYYLSRELGEGKTLSPVLYIITTARKRDTLEWEEECAHFDMENVEVHVDSWNNITKYTDISGCFFLFDEQRVVGSGSWVKAFLKIARSNRWILLTATPGDCWMDYAPVFIANGFYRNRTDFINRHVVYRYTGKFYKIDRYTDNGYLNGLRRKITVEMPFKRMVEYHHDLIRVSYDKATSDIVLKQRWDPFKEEPLMDISAVCYTLRKVVNSDPSRIEKVKEILESHPKAIIFYNFNYELELLRTLDIEKAEWNGQKHEPIPKGDRWVYLVQYTAGAEGWNCITTDTIIFYSQSYSYKAMIQAAGRTDRMNTPYKHLWYYHLSSSSKIDLAIERALKSKKNFNESSFFGS